MKKLLFLLLTASALFAVAPNWKKHSARLYWDYPNVTNITGFKIYHGVATRDYTNVITIPKWPLTYTVTNLAASTTYYWSMTAFDEFGIESDYSNEATNTTPAKATPPGQVRVTTTTAE